MSVDVSYENGTLIVTRQFNAPRTAVFDAWIKTSKVELWWGCGYATEVKSTIEPKVGGKYHHLMTLPETGEYPHHGLITEYDPPVLLAYELVDAYHDEKMLVRVEFTEEEGKTTVRLTQRNLLDAYSEFVMSGWASALDGLAYFLETGGLPRERSLKH
ncbi:SRPBCC family protein [Candidatus Leptofilum sp.]|uniref:SRPBCC family protein n=1 Tax=Candidatus Leptofilum sp. TaxID=3241576 RepID=UPI003B5A4101